MTNHLIRALVLAVAAGAVLSLTAGPAFAHGGDLGIVGKQTLVQAAATYIGVTQAEIETARKAGQSLAQLATAKGKTVQGLTDALVAAGNASIDAAQTAGKITAAQAGTARAALPAQVQVLINATGAGGCAGGSGHRAPATARRR